MIRFRFNPRRACFRATLSVMLLAPLPVLAQGGGWQRCAVQDEVCRFDGTATVRYGVDGKFAYKSARNRIICDQQEFGDPAYGQRKQCDVATDGGQSPDAQASGWIPCASEGESCRFRGAARVRYGTDNRYAYRNATNEIRCSVSVFGDPAYGAHKTCDYQPHQTTGTLRPQAGGWELCATEGGFCSFSGPGEVRYGAKGQFLSRRAINGMPCNVDAFGRDPIVGQHKQCFVRTGAR